MKVKLRYTHGQGTATVTYDRMQDDYSSYASVGIYEFYDHDGNALVVSVNNVVSMEIIHLDNQAPPW